MNEENVRRILREAEEQKRISKQHKQDMKERTAYQTKVHKLRFLHVRPRGLFGEVLSKRGVTLAYTLHKGKHAATVSTAYCHPSDCYNKLIGRSIAANAYAVGASTVVRIPKHIHPVVFLDSLFSQTLS